jgi:hypothetical protein
MFHFSAQLLEFSVLFISSSVLIPGQFFSSYKTLYCNHGILIFALEDLPEATFADTIFSVPVVG